VEGCRRAEGSSDADAQKDPWRGASDTLISMGNLAGSYRNQGQWKEAEELEVQVMQMHKRILGEEHPFTLNSKENLAATYRNQGRWKKAEELEVQVMQMHKRILVP